MKTERKQSRYEEMVKAFGKIEEYVRCHATELIAVYGRERLALTYNNGKVEVIGQDADASVLGRKIEKTGIMSRQVVVINTIEGIINPVKLVLNTLGAKI